MTLQQFCLVKVPISTCCWCFCLYLLHLVCGRFVVVETFGYLVQYCHSVVCWWVIGTLNTCWLLCETVEPCWLLLVTILVTVWVIIWWLCLVEIHWDLLFPVLIHWSHVEASCYVTYTRVPLNAVVPLNV